MRHSSGFTSATKRPSINMTWRPKVGAHSVSCVPRFYTTWVSHVILLKKHGSLLEYPNLIMHEGKTYPVTLNSLAYPCYNAGTIIVDVIQSAGCLCCSLHSV